MPLWGIQEAFTWFGFSWDQLPPFLSAWFVGLSRKCQAKEWNLPMKTESAWIVNLGPFYINGSQLEQCCPCRASATSEILLAGRVLLCGLGLQWEDVEVLLNPLQNTEGLLLSPNKELSGPKWQPHQSGEILLYIKLNVTGWIGNNMMQKGVIFSSKFFQTVGGFCVPKPRHKCYRPNQGEITHWKLYNSSTNMKMSVCERW